MEKEVGKAISKRVQPPESVINGIRENLQGEIIYHNDGTKNFVNPLPAQVPDIIIVGNIVLIINVQKGTSAEAAGLRGTRQVGADIILGDIIISVNSKPVSSYDDLRNEFDTYKTGQLVNLGIIRGNDKLTVPVKLEEVQ